MVSEFNKCYNLTEIFTEDEVDVIIRKALGNGQWRLVRSDFKQMSDGLTGFLGDHIKGALHIEADGRIFTLFIFIKRMPRNNKPKADFITEHNYYKRERLVFSLFGNLEDFDSNPWIPKGYIYTDELLVLPDLSAEGYASRHHLDTLDLSHVLITATSLARFHAAYANYESKKCVNNVPYNILNDYGDIMEEPTFKESPWLRAAAKLTANFLATFSTKYRSVDLESVLNVLYVEACDSLRDYEDTVNVLLHKDLWMNNIMFKYENGVPVNAILVDFQCLRYAPPAFDLMVFLYLTTSRSFREKHEGEVLRHYYNTFCSLLDDKTTERIRNLGYDKEEFLDWCNRSRMFGMLETITIFPFVLMDPKTAEKTFDDPDTYAKYLHEDRSEPVIAYANKCSVYKERQVEVCEEFVERYVLNDIRQMLVED
ncbi:uncharacterized protein LOC115440870 [Manduca sexta]|uniref:uncharacterized protein LOC115440870 n=1 Tax=Manduca sexta TaxID=7130 RepID=UPI00188E0803|nr:uncharacterized protein LOC115440870 [Manduca sexta]